MKYSGKKSSKKYRNRFLKITLYIIFFTILGTFLLLTLPYFRIKEMKISGIEHSKNAELHTKLDSRILDKNIFLMSNNDVEQIISDEVPRYLVEDIARIPPGFIDINLKERDPKYYVKVGDDVYAIDRDYFITQKASSDEEYNISYDKTLDVGTEINDGVLLAALQYSNLNSLVYVKNNDIYIELDGGGKVLLPEEDAVEKSAELSNLLQKIIQKYTIENRAISVIDLRYSKPLIKFR